MRRFLVWSAMALILGVAIAAGGYWAYWNFYARFQPVTLTRNQADIQRLLDEASWLSSGGGGEPLYLIAYRDNAPARRYELEEFPKLRAAGVETRVIVFARPDHEGQAQSTPAERSTVAELWLTRDWSLYERWTATPSRNWTAPGVPRADGDMARSGVVEVGRDFATRLNALVRGAGVSSGYPLILWRDRQGFLKACACSDERSWAFIRDDLGAPDRTSDEPAMFEETAPPVEGTAPPARTPTPYPDLAPPPEEAAPDPARPSSATATGAQPAPPPARPTTPREPPRAEQQEDTTFF